ncbi:MAG: NADP-dependent isocitrate dehydrogenase [Magnetococcales bacterium]|nr:NADP-dependent isocitrate dehydrogenase [Magnetococcales bacterium]
MSTESRITPPDIIYTKVDEAPELASASLLPIVRAFLHQGGITVGTRDISLANRILAAFPEKMPPHSVAVDDLQELAELVTTPTANVIKLPNISASVPQLKAAIRELQNQGYPLPDYPETFNTPEEKEIRDKYDRVKGSAVNPVLREGNSDRRVPRSVKEYARKNPHSMGKWHSDSKTHVATMEHGDFFHNEKSVTITTTDAGKANIEWVSEDGTVAILKRGVELKVGAVVDATFMDIQALIAFLEEQIRQASAQGVLFSLHLKATMMKVSDPILFGHAVVVYFREVFAKYGQIFAQLGVDAKNGLGDLLSRVQTLPSESKDRILADIQQCMARQPPLFMVNSDKGITNLHVPSDVIIDASMPALIRAGGKGWGPDGRTYDVKCVIPDSSYAGIYQETIDFCKQNGAFDPTTMGSVANVGLMAQQAEEYGSHATTFSAPGEGRIRVVAADGVVLLEHTVRKGDVWRLCRTNDAAIQDWVRLAVNRARLTATPAVFWLDSARAHDQQLRHKVEQSLQSLETTGLDIRILPPREATRLSLQRAREGKDTISVTGNVLRDYNTDLFPILEVGTSAKMLSIVPLMQGGGLFETGAGGSAPKHVQQFMQEGHLRWDSLGEFAALAAALEHLSMTRNYPLAALMAKTLDRATEQVLINDQSPKPDTGKLDNRGSHYYLALYWAQALAEQNDNDTIKQCFIPIHAQLLQKQADIIAELNATQGQAIDLGGYYHCPPEKMAAAMRPSRTFNAIIDGMMT